MVSPTAVAVSDFVSLSSELALGLISSLTQESNSFMGRSSRLRLMWPS